MYSQCYHAVNRRFVSFLFCLPFANRASVSGDLYIDFDRNHLIFPVAYLVCQVTALFILFLPEHAYASHIISRISYMFCIMLLVHFSWLIEVPFVCVLVLDRAGRRVREWGTCWVRLRGSSFRQLWEPCRQDDHTLEITSIFALLVVRSIAMLRYLPLAISCLPYFPCQASNHPFLANRCLAKLPLLLSPSYSVASCRWSWSWFHVGTWIFWNITISLIILMHLYIW